MTTGSHNAELAALIWLASRRQPAPFGHWAGRRSDVVNRNKTSAFRQGVLRILPHSGASNTTMRTIFVILLLALTAITFEIYSDLSLTSAEFSRNAAPDAAAVAVAHGLKQG
jgi:hypothetical protein